MKFYLMATALKNEVALDFLENLKMGDRVIQEIKKEKDMHEYTDSNNKNEKGVKDIKGRKIQITVPDGYDFVQEGNSCYFIKKKDNKNFASWEQKDKLVTGYFIDNESKVCKLKAFSNKSSRSQEDRNVFNNFEQASGSLGLSMLSQQIEDVNQDWYPKWCSDDIKYCIVRDCIGHSYKLTVEECTNRYHFLAFKTREDAELFIENNDEELFRASVFI
jgi:hypothetical protein